MLVIGCGAGVTAGAVSVDPAVEHETIAEIEPLVPRVVSTYFARAQLRRRPQPEGARPASTMRATSSLTTSEKFDAVTSDPLDPWVKGAAMLYTAEFFELVEAAPEPGRRRHAVRAAVREQHRGGEERDRRRSSRRSRTASCSATPTTAQGYDLVLLGQVEPTQIDVDAIEAKLQRPEYAPMAQSLREIGFNSAIDLFATFAGRKADLRAVAERRADQPRPQPAAAVSRRPRAEPLSSRRDLLRHAALRHQDARRPVRCI